MVSFLLLSLFAGLSTQLPTSEEATHYIEARDASPHVIPIRREFNPEGEKVRRAATAGISSVQDNRQLKYFIPVTIGSQTVELELDSGSSGERKTSCFLASTETDLFQIHGSSNPTSSVTWTLIRIALSSSTLSQRAIATWAKHTHPRTLSYRMMSLFS